MNTSFDLHAGSFQQKAVAIVLMLFLMIPMFFAGDVPVGGRIVEAMLPVDAHANLGTGAGGVNVEMDSNGNIILEGNGVNFGDDSSSSWNEIFRRYRSIIIGLSGFATLTMLAAFIFLFTKLGTTSGNESERRKVITGILFTGIATALLGSVTIVMGFFYNAFVGL